MLEKVQAALAAQLHLLPEEIGPDDDIREELGADSLDLLALLTKIEDEFATVIPDEALEQFHSVSDIAAYLEARFG